MRTDQAVRAALVSPTRGIPLRAGALLGSLLGLQLALALFGVLAKDVVGTVAPLTLEGARRAIAAAILVLGLVLTGRQVRPTRRDALDAIIPGVIGFGFARACVMVALSMTSATNVALIDSSAPAMALALAMLAGLERPRRTAVIASVVAFAGVGGLVLAGGLTGPPSLGDVIALGSPLSWGAIYVWLARRSPDPASRLRRTAWFSLAGAAALAGPALAPGAAALGALFDPGIGLVLAIGVGIGVVENNLTFRGIETLGAVRTAELEYLVPILTAVLGLALFGVPLLPIQALAIVVVVGALVVGNRARTDRSGPVPLPGQPCCVT
jgi:drug/metabolite transporter (DMT)-like permease